MCTYNTCGVVRPYVHHIHIYGDKHTSAREEIEMSPSNLSEGGSLCSPIRYIYICRSTLDVLVHILLESWLSVDKMQPKYCTLVHLSTAMPWL